MHRARNPAEIQNYQLLADDFYDNPDRYRDSEQKRRKREIKKLHTNYSMQPIQDAFFDLPMGHDKNHVSKSGADILHFFFSGLCKNAVTYILIICHQVIKFSDNTEFCNLSNILEERIMNFPKLFEALPHVQWTYFRSGLVNKLVQHMSSSNKGRSTGKGGGFRSAHFLPALLQIYFCLVGILPTNKKFKISRTQRNQPQEVVHLGDVNSVVCEAIKSLLHFYFEVCRDYWNTAILHNFRRLVNSVRKSYYSLWELKQLSIFRDPKDPPLKGLKLHMLDHFPDQIFEFGPADGWDTSSTERFHKILKAIWRTTSRRYQTEISELMTQIHLKQIEKFYNDKLLFLAGSYSTSVLSENLVVYFAEETTKFSCSQKTKIIPVYLDLGENLRSFSIKGILMMEKKKLIKFEKYLQLYLLEEYGDITTFTQAHKLYQRLIVTITGNLHSGFVKVLLHAYENKRFKWFDFVEVSIGNNDIWLAQTLEIFEIVSEATSIFFCQVSRSLKW